MKNNYNFDYVKILLKNDHIPNRMLCFFRKILPCQNLILFQNGVYLKKGMYFKMFIGKWNKSVILTYIGLAISILGMRICFSNNENSINLAMVCLIIAGICDLFDGQIARKCKRTEQEKNFGIELDSLVDTIDFIALPTVLFLKLQMNTWYYYFVIVIFAICGIARLAYFNITIEDNSKPVEYYIGLPVTYTALIFPICYLLKYILPFNIFLVIYSVLIVFIAILNIIKIKIKKPKGFAYLLFSLLAIIMIVLYLGVL